MKLIIKRLYIVFFLALSVVPVFAAENINNISLSVTPANADQSSSWSISFIAPANISVKEVVVSLTGSKPDLSSASGSVSGLSIGSLELGASDSNCLAGCQEIKYFLNNESVLSKGSKVSFNLSNVLNPKADRVGIESITLFSYSSGKQVVASGGWVYQNLSTIDMPDLEPEELLPEETTNSENETVKLSIEDLSVPAVFQKEGAIITDLRKLKQEDQDDKTVSDFVLDDPDRGRVEFLKDVDFSKSEVINAINNADTSIDFEDDYIFTINRSITDNIEGPYRITFYDSPFVWLPILYKNGDTLNNGDYQNFSIYENHGQNLVSFVINKSGEYELKPNFEVDWPQKDVGDSNYQISGRISDPSCEISVYINSKKIDSTVIINQTSGSFTATTKLEEGSNLVRIEPDTKYGSIEALEELVVYNPNTDKPINQDSKLFYWFLYGIIGIVLFALVVLKLIPKKKKK